MIEHAKKVYLVGIKGVGMTAFAQILQARGVEVSGSDTQEKFFTDEVLRRLRIPFQEGFDAGNVPENIDLVITSPAYIKSDNPEIQEAERRGLKIITWHDALAELFNNAHGIAVTGTHGKSTTTAMLGVVLEHAGLDPTVVVGSRVNKWKSNALVGRSEYFVIEADEYRDSFLHYFPKMIVLTNIDYDHPDYFKTEEQYRESFKKFTSRVPATHLVTTATSSRGQTPRNEGEFKLKMPGEYNQQNANLAYQAALKLGVKKEIAREALESFTGLARRFEHYGQYGGAELYDDYAHHPTEIKALLKGAREYFPGKKIIVVFQPHTFSRTKGLFKEFTGAFGDADEVFILKTYGSAREGGPDEWGEKLAESLHTAYFNTREEAAEALRKKLDNNTVLFTVGAGDGWQILKQLLE